MKKSLLYFIIALLLGAYSCQTGVREKEAFSIQFEKYMLDNGLNVVLHEDHSDPIVAVAIQYHVGSNREVSGKTGFAHLFEHMMFQQSENVGQDQFFKKIQGSGGNLNGGTNKDGTVYFEVVPKNALEMVLWLESDRMGYLINTVTRSAFANQQNVVQNEKRQNYDNRPYGHNGYVISKNLYPQGHPYSWLTIGVMEDLFNATVDDVKAFHGKYYVPNNATLVIAGDFNKEEVKAMVEKYFGEIPGGEKVVDLDPMPVTLEETRKLYHEDNFATSPLLTMVWPTVEQYTPDAYALDLLAELLSGSKKSPMYKILVKEKNLTSRVFIRSGAQELAGEFTISVTANTGVSLADVESAIFGAFQKFETDTITESDLERIKAGLETQFYNSISSILMKSFQLARYNEYAGSPGFISQDIANIKAVTIDDVKRVYEKYIKGKNYVATSFVPKGKADLAAANSVNAGIVEENIATALEVKVTGEAEEEIVKTPSKFDRSVEPAVGPDPEITLPVFWTGDLENGMKIWGIEHTEVPLVQYSISFDGGHMLDAPGKSGVASLVAGMMTEGTRSRTPEELEEAIDLLGASIRVFAGEEELTIMVNCLARNYEKTLDLVEEILLEPRWDEEQFALAKTRVLNGLRRNKANPNYLASSALSRLMLGENNIFAVEVSGTEESVAGITIDDLKAYFDANLSPSVARMHVVGALGQERVMNSLTELSIEFVAKEVTFPSVGFPPAPEKSAIYFVDVPGAKQSVINIGTISIPRTHSDYYPAWVANYKLGGTFNGNLNLILREEKGYTYGARSNFVGNKNYGYFTASSSVRSTATLESVGIFKTEMEKYREGISDEDLTFTKEALLKGNALRFETLGALMNMISTMSSYDLPADYIRQEEDFVRSLDKEKHRELVNKYIDPSRMYYVVAGDAASQFKELEKAGLGKPVMLE